MAKYIFLLVIILVLIFYGERYYDNTTDKFISENIHLVIDVERYTPIGEVKILYEVINFYDHFYFLNNDIKIIKKDICKKFHDMTEIYVPINCWVDEDRFAIIRKQVFRMIHKNRLSDIPHILSKQNNVVIVDEIKHEFNSTELYSDNQSDNIYSGNYFYVYC